MFDYLDISVPISPDIPVWPGSPTVSLGRRRDLDKGDKVNDTTLNFSVHTGTHIDAPAHFIKGAKTNDLIPLEILIGPAEVVELQHVERITAADLDGAEISPETRRLLIKTRNSKLWLNGISEFRQDYVGLTADAAQWVVERGIRLVGIDYLSIQIYQDEPDTHLILLGAEVVIITGVCGGIGAATVRCFADAGWRVVGMDMRPSKDLSGIHRLIRADCSDPTAVEEVFTGLAEQEGQLDALVNNAAIQICKPLVETLPEEWDAVMAANVRSVYLNVRGAHPLLCRRGGAVVNVSSVHAVATSANLAAYAASKGAILALTRGMAIELAPDGIRVNAVLPGAVDTPMLADGLKRGAKSEREVQQKRAYLESHTVLGRVGQPREIAQAILFLADNERSSFITGQALVVDGGATSRLSTE